MIYKIIRFFEALWTWTFTGKFDMKVYDWIDETSHKTGEKDETNR